MNIPAAEELFDLSHTMAKDLLAGCESAYQALPKIKEAILKLIPTLSEEYEEIAPSVYAAKSAVISKSATIEGPTIIGKDTEIRPGAFIRGSVLIGDGAVIGNSTELKNAVIFDGAQLPHYNYVGDSIVGYKAHMGAGAIASNFRLDHNQISIKADGERISTGLRKMGVLLGDFAEIGCNSVLCPGSIIGRGCIVYPLSRFIGVLPESSIYCDGKITVKREK